jgi:hypothetical protein
VGPGENARIRAEETAYEAYLILTCVFNKALWPAMNAVLRSPWAVARTVIAASGLGFAATALGGACLDYAGESFGTCPTGSPVTTTVASTGAGSGTGDGTSKAGSGVGNGAPAPATAMDCGTSPTSVPEAGGSGSAAP